jgi:hypothetical protein
MAIDKKGQGVTIGDTHHLSMQHFCRAGQSIEQEPPKRHIWAEEAFTGV